MLAGIAIGHYGTLIKHDFYTIQLFLGVIGCNVFMFVLPPLSHKALGVPFNKDHKIIFGILDSLVALMSILYLSGIRQVGLMIGAQILMFLYVLYGAAIGLLYSGSIGSNKTRLFLRTVFITTLIFFPLLVADAFLGQLPFLPYNLSLPIYLLVVSFELLVFLIMHLDQPAFLEANGLTSHCIEVLKLTEREKEIIESLLKGHTNKQIGEELFISIKTVENHLYNVYQKAGVKNRTQLLNLIHTNSAS